MSLVDFWNAIHDGGQLRIGPPIDSSGARLAEARAGDTPARALEAAVREVEADWRRELPHEPPPLDVPVALWALRRMYAACQFLVYRDRPGESVTRALDEPCPGAGPASPAACYSADLALRVLPDVIRLARAASPDDPLVAALLALAARWPLSSVGVDGLPAALDVSALVRHPCLRRLYADRIIERGDRSRLSDPDAAEAVRESLGGHPQLAPASFAGALEGRTGE